MELTMVNNLGFCELNENEMMETEGGGWFSTWFDFGWTVYDILSPSHGHRKEEEFMQDYRVI